MQRKTAYLTIDDGPSPVFKEKIDFLHKKNIPAILYCRGDLLEKNLNAAVFTIKKGFVIGNHSYSHPRFSQLTIKESINEIEKTESLIEQGYKKASKKRPAKLFRFPYGDKGVSNKSPKFIFRRYNKKFIALQNYLKKKGFQKLSLSVKRRSLIDLLKVMKTMTTLNNIMKKDIDNFWTYDVGEWTIDYKDSGNTFEKIIKQMDLHLSGTSNEIILVHDHERTHKYFKKIINKLIELEFSFSLPNFNRKNNNNN